MSCQSVWDRSSFQRIINHAEAIYLATAKMGFEIKYKDGIWHGHLYAFRPAFPESPLLLVPFQSEGHPRPFVSSGADISHEVAASFMMAALAQPRKKRATPTSFSESSVGLSLLSPHAGK